MLMNMLMNIQAAEIDSLTRDLAADALELRQTHISLLFFHRDRVYKVKKRVFFGFLDFRTLANRKAACDAELVLNRRLAHSVYLDVAPVCRTAQGHYQIRGPGEIVDYAVEMRRLADGDAADQRLARGELSREQVMQLGVAIARFHRAARTDGTIAAFGHRATLEQNILENFEQTRTSAPEHLSASDIAEIEHFQLGFVRANEALLDRRVRAGAVRDGHGDLRLEHVYLHDGDIAVIDCIEFNERFRYADVCADLAFLAMDLAWHERDDLAQALLSAYSREAQDYTLYRLIDFYESYRAYVRGKVTSFALSSGGLTDAARDKAAADVRKYYLLALACARPSLRRPVLCAVGGLIAAGKSTVVEQLTAALSAVAIDADTTRKHVFDVAATQSLAADAFAGAYAPDASSRVYAELGVRARDVLQSGRPVVLDASFRSQADRLAMRALASELGVDFVFVECRAPRPVLEQRLAQRENAGTALVSDARLPLLESFMRSYEPVTELNEQEHIVLDTTAPLPALVAQCVARVKQR
jgi:aminoglycoside phosphotransferase family enzyme/predicted kinase